MKGLLQSGVPFFRSTTTQGSWQTLDVNGTPLMRLGNIPPQTSLPAAKSSWKTTRVDDVINLIKVIEGNDPAWRFLEMRQIDEIRRNITQAIRPSCWAAAQNNSPAALDTIQEAIELGKSGASPFLAREMCIAQIARERLARWEAGKTTDFNDAPIGLRLLLNTRTRPMNRRLIDNEGIAMTPDLKHAIRLAEKAGWIQGGQKEVPQPSNESRERLLGSLKSSVVRPAGLESLAVILKVPPHDMAALAREVVTHAEADLQALLKPLREVADPVSVATTTNVATKLPIVEHAIEMLSLRVRRGASRDEIIRAVDVALGALGDASVRRSRASKELVAKVAEICVPQDPSGAKVGAAESYIAAWSTQLRGLQSGFSELIPGMKFYVTSRGVLTNMRDHKGFALQREVLAIAAQWLSRADVPSDIKPELKAILIKGTSPFGSRLTIESAVYWIARHQEQFSVEQLRQVSLGILTNDDRSFLHHSLYISGRSARGEGRVEALGALEMVIDLIKAGRFGVEEGSAAYRAAGHYKIMRDKETGNGLWLIQRAETEALMLELDQLCGGEPRNKWEAELWQMAEERRLTRNEKVRLAKARADRMRALAAKAMSRMSQG